MKKIMVICATVATLGAGALSSVQASARPANGPAADQIYGLSAAGSHGELLGERRPEAAIGAFGLKFRQADRESRAVCGVWGIPCFY